MYSIAMDSILKGLHQGVTPFPDFESGVVKIQRGEFGEINDAEKAACVPLLKE